MTTTTAPIKLSTALVNELLDAAVAEKGADHVYPFYQGTCAYATAITDDGREFPSTSIGDDEDDEPDYKLVPGCLVGNVLARAGVPLDEISWREQDAEDTISELISNEVLAAADTDAVGLLQLAQKSQDRGTPWGVSVELARRARFVDRHGDVVMNSGGQSDS